jgi:hypothetical protein
MTVTFICLNFFVCGSSLLLKLLELEMEGEGIAWGMVTLLVLSFGGKGGGLSEALPVVISRNLGEEGEGEEGEGEESGLEEEVEGEIIPGVLLRGTLAGMVGCGIDLT